MTNSLYLQGVLGVAKVFLINIVGFVFGRYPRRDFGLLNSGFVKDLSKILINLLYPCLIFFSVGSAFDPGEFSTLLPLCLWSVVGLLVSFLIAKLCSLIFPQIDVFFKIAIIMPNTIVLPLLVLESVCENDPIDSAQCLAEAGTFAFTFNIAVQSTFWGIIYPYFKRMKKNGELPVTPLENNLSDILMNEIDEECECNSPNSVEMAKQKETNLQTREDYGCFYIIRQFLHSNNVALIIGFAVGSWKWLQEALFDPSFSFAIFGLTAKTIGAPTIVMSSFVASALLAHSVDDINFFRAFSSCFPSKYTTDVKKNKRSQIEDKDDIVNRPSVIVIFVCIFARLVIIPAILMFLLYAVSLVSFLSPIFPSEPKILLYLSLAFASPSALICVIFTSELGFKQQSHQMAFMFLFMYIIAMFTLSSFLSLSSFVFSI